MRRKPGRPRSQVSADEVKQLRDQQTSWRTIARTLRTSTATAMRVYDTVSRAGKASQNSGEPSEDRELPDAPAVPLASIRISRLPLPLIAAKDDRVWPAADGRSPGRCSKCGGVVWRRRVDGALDCDGCRPLHDPL